MAPARTLETVLDSCRRGGIYASERISVHDRDAFGDTPLHIVAQWGDTEAASLLIGAGAEVNAVGDRGRTPLFCTSSLAMAQLLIKAGANIEHRDDDGLTAKDVARLLKRAELEKLLSKLM